MKLKNFQCLAHQYSISVSWMNGALKGKHLLDSYSWQLAPAPWLNLVSRRKVEQFEKKHKDKLRERKTTESKGMENGLCIEKNTTWHCCLERGSEQENNFAS